MGLIEQMRQAEAAMERERQAADAEFKRRIAQDSEQHRADRVAGEKYRIQSDQAETHFLNSGLVDLCKRFRNYIASRLDLEFHGVRDEKGDYCDPYGSRGSGGHVQSFPSEGLVPYAGARFEWKESKDAGPLKRFFANIDAYVTTKSFKIECSPAGTIVFGGGPNGSTTLFLSQWQTIRPNGLLEQALERAYNNPYTVVREEHGGPVHYSSAGSSGGA